jgi:hypothetical protein
MELARQREHEEWQARHPRSGVRPICSLTLVGIAQTLRDDPMAALERSVTTTCLSSLSAQVNKLRQFENGAFRKSLWAFAYL